MGYGKTIGRDGVLVEVKHIIWTEKKDSEESCFKGGGIDKRVISNETNIINIGSMYDTICFMNIVCFT